MNKQSYKEVSLLKRQDKKTNGKAGDAAHVGAGPNVQTGHASGEWTDEALRVAIATARGWKYGNLAGVNEPIVKGYSSTGWFEPDGQHHDTAPPNYPSDLNACHEMEKVLTDEQRRLYWNTIFQACMVGDVLEHGFRIVHIEPRAKCIAFVTALGLSPDGTNASGVSVPNKNSTAAIAKARGTNL